MTRYSTEPRDQIFVKGYRFLSLAKNMGKNIGKDISKNLSDKYKVSKNSQLNNSETVKCEHDKIIPKERYICISEESQKIIDDLRLI